MGVEQFIRRIFQSRRSKAEDALLDTLRESDGRIIDDWEIDWEAFKKDVDAILEARRRGIISTENFDKLWDEARELLPKGQLIITGKHKSEEVSRAIIPFKKTE